MRYTSWYSKNFFLFSLLLLAGNTYSQSVAINTDGTTAHSSAILDIKSTSKGLLIPRMTSTERTVIASPAQGLFVFDITTNSFWYYNGTTWNNLAQQASAPSAVWMLQGNSNTNSQTDFIGTTDNQPLIFKILNARSGIIDSTANNTAFGFKSSFQTVKGALNPDFGDYTGTWNTSFGYKSLFTNSVGIGNVAIGANTLRLNESGGYNTAVGVHALFSNVSGNFNIAIGGLSLYDNLSGTSNVAIGQRALASNKTGYSNIAIGPDALLLNVSSSNLVAVGDSSLFLNNTGQYNTAIGSKASYSNTTGSQNTSLGYQALYSNVTTNENTAIGMYALHDNTASANTAIGYFALRLNKTGSHNTAVGDLSLWLNEDGYNNTALGDYASYNNSSGQGNVAIGFEALNNNTTGDVNTAIGAQADVVFGNQSNTTLIGHFAKAASSNKVRIGNAAVTVIEGQVAYTYPSDGRFKTNVTEDIKGLDFIMKLRPVSYNFQTKKYESFMNGGQENAKAFSKLDFTESENLRHNGFIAQEVEKAAKDVGYDFDGVIAPKNERDTYGLSYSQFVVPLVKAVQEQQQQIDELKKENSELKKLLLKLQQQIDELKK